MIKPVNDLKRQVKSCPNLQLETYIPPAIDIYAPICVSTRSYIIVKNS